MLSIVDRTLEEWLTFFRCDEATFNAHLAAADIKYKTLSDGRIRIMRLYRGRMRRRIRAAS